MRAFYLIFVCELSRSLCAWTDNYRVDPDLSSYGRDRGIHFQSDRFNTKFYTKTEGELEHAVNDGRCPLMDETRIPRPTKYGTVNGRKVYLCDGPGVNLRERPGQPDVKAYRAVNVFLGIPYALPPTRHNKLQFKPPQLPQPWNEIEAVTYKPACPQHNKYLGRHKGVNNTDEDCLYLNIFSPDSSQERKPLNKYSVMIYIHGGNWDHGAANIFPGHVLAASQEVIVVTFNYRLGHLGFLATADSASPGNYGMLDQIMAIEWVSENIKNFAGDPQNITLFGSGAGAASAGLLAISPRCAGLVKRIIAQSGAPVADWAAIFDPRFMFNTSRILGEALGCTTQNSSRLIDCIGKRSKNEIQILEIKPRIGWLPWGPVVDNFTTSKPFLPLSPIDLLEKGHRFPHTFAYMSGVTRDEGVSLILEDQRLKRLNYKINEEIFDWKVKDFMNMYNYSVNADGIFNAITFMYKPWSAPTNETLLRQGYINLLSDRYYKAPNDRMVKLLLKNKVPTYMYVLNYTFEGYYTPAWHGVPHDMEYLLITGAPFMDPKFYPPYLNLDGAKWTEADRNMSQFFLQSWANFAKEGNPTPNRLFNTILWNPMSEKDLQFLDLNATNSTVAMEKDYRQRECQFWNSYLPFFIDREPPTLAPTFEPGLEELRMYSNALWGSVSAAALFLIITLVCCTLYCRIRRKDECEDVTSSREVIVNHAVTQRDTLV